jgi:hypothetical protein
MHAIQMQLIARQIRTLIRTQNPEKNQTQLNHVTNPDLGGLFLRISVTLTRFITFTKSTLVPETNAYDLRLLKLLSRLSVKTRTSCHAKAQCDRLMQVVS